MCRQMLRKLGKLAGVMDIIGISLRVANDELVMVRLIASVLIASVVPVMITCVSKYVYLFGIGP